MGLHVLHKTLRWQLHKPADPISQHYLLSGPAITSASADWDGVTIQTVWEMELDNHPRAIAIIGLWLLDYWLCSGASKECADVGGGGGSGGGGLVCTLASWIWCKYFTLNRNHSHTGKGENYFICLQVKVVITVDFCIFWHICWVLWWW